MNKSHRDCNQNIFRKDFPLVLGGPWGPTKGPHFIFFEKLVLSGPI